jgi:hypothetical protein
MLRTWERRHPVGLPPEDDVTLQPNQIASRQPLRCPQSLGSSSLCRTLCQAVDTLPET